MKRLLIEIFVEEIPAGELSSIEAQLVANLKKGISSLGVGKSQFETVVTPNRLGFLLYLPPKLDLDSGGVQKLFNAIFAKLQFEEKMHWGEGFEFIRPVRNILVLWEKTLIPIKWGRLKSKPQTRSPWFVGGEWVEVKSVDEYFARLKQWGVIWQLEKRRQEIVKRTKKCASQLGFNFTPPKQLLEEVVGLVEAPQVEMGEFSPKYLSLPKELIELVAAKHQRYFVLLSQEGELSNYFLTVLNGKHKNKKEIVAHNAAVLEARLEDARFYWEKDGKISLKKRKKLLAKTPFVAGGGTLEDKTKRMLKLGELWGQFAGLSLNKKQRLAKAISLAKIDLTTHLVAEFPELAGTIAKYLLQKEKLAQEVKEAIGEQYLPREDQLPQTEIGAILAVIDKLDDILFFAKKGWWLTSEKDPLGLRRRALGIIQILQIWNFPLYWDEFLKKAAGLFDLKQKQKQEIIDFFHIRFQNWLVDEKGVSSQVAAAVAEKPMVNFAWEVKVAEALAMGTLSPLIGGLKRITNILRRAKVSTMPESLMLPQRNLEKEEKRFWQATRVFEKTLKNQFFVDSPSWEKLLQITSAIDRFFAKVLVMDPDTKKRTRRFQLLTYWKKLSLFILNLEKYLGSK